MTRRVSEIEELYIATISGKADSGSTTTLVDSGLTAYDDDAFNNMVLSIIKGTNKGQSRRISDFDGSTGTITVDTAFTSAIDSTSEYIVKHLIVFAAVTGGDATLAKQDEILEDIVDIKGTGFVKDTHSLKNIKDLIDALNDLAQSDILSDATPFAGADIASTKAYVDEVESLLKNATYGLSALDTDLGTIITDTADIQPRVPRIVCHIDFWSLAKQITITATAGDQGLVDVVVSGLPSGVTIIKVLGMFICDSVENSYDGTNYLESTKIQVKEKTAGSDTDAIVLEANKVFRFADAVIRGGTAFIADDENECSGEVDANGTYQMWFDVAEAAQNNIVLDGAAFGLRIYFTV